MTLADTALITLTQARAYLRVDAVASLSILAEAVGTGDGETVAFTLDHAPLEGTYRIYVDSVLQVEPTDYSISSMTLTFAEAPGDGEVVTAAYDYAASEDTFESYDDDVLERMIEAATAKAEDWTGRAFVQDTLTETYYGNGSSVLNLYRRPVVSVTSVAYRKVGDFEGDGETVAFILSATPVASSYYVYVDGELQTETDDYSISGTTLTFVAAPDDGALIIVRYNVALVLNADYTEQLSIGRLKGSWLAGYEYVVVYTAGHAATRGLAQVEVPGAVLAVLLILADLHEVRSDKADAVSLQGIGSTSYKLPSLAEELLQPLKVGAF